MVGQGAWQQVTQAGPFSVQQQICLQAASAEGTATDAAAAALRARVNIRSFFFILVSLDYGQARWVQTVPNDV